MQAVDPVTLDEDVEALLWSMRFEDAETWFPPIDEPFDAPCGEPFDAPLAAASVAKVFPLDASALRREELVREWERAAREVARWHGEQARILAESLDLALALDHGSDVDMSARSLAAELACAVGMSDRTIERQMNDAQTMRDRFTAVYAAVRDGRLGRAHALAIVEVGLRLTGDAHRAEYERLVLERGKLMTTGRLRAMAAAIAEQLMPTTVGDRHRAAREQRGVVVRDGDDGMSEVSTLVPSVLAHGIFDRLTRDARTVKAAAADAIDPDERTIDQIRADVFCDILLTGQASAVDADRGGGDGIDAIRAVVQIVVPIATLLGEDGAPACLAGRTPIDLESARRLAGNATMWDRILTDPISGDVIAVDRRFPTAAQQRFLRARDEHCRFPGCRMPVWRCDIDHTVDHQCGGPTESCNLAHLCRRHHMLKHSSAWRVEQRAGGVLVWTSPAGRVYTDRPPPTLRFVPT
ncbi:MAG: DUF222 domain-containing protein [Microbacterium sp.]